MTKRQEQLLQTILENYIRTAEPVGSKFLAEAGGFELSGATLRNEMRELEEAGYLTHPHTSAGRIPTELGYKYYVEHIMTPEVPKKKIQDSFAKIKEEQDPQKRMKLVAKAVASYTNSAVILAFNPDTIYYTGMSHLFSQPEFYDMSHRLNITTLFDQCEDRVDRLYQVVESGINQIFVGEENPLGSGCGTISRRVGRDALFNIIGPMRMDYGKAVGILEYITSIN